MIITGIFVNDVSCSGGNDGFVELDISGGTPDYSISGDTTGLGAGTYSVTVIDANGCETSGEFSVDEPDEFEVSLDKFRFSIILFTAVVGLGNNNKSPPSQPINSPRTSLEIFKFSQRLWRVSYCLGNKKNEY